MSFANELAFSRLSVPSALRSASTLLRYASACTEQSYPERTERIRFLDAL